MRVYTVHERPRLGPEGDDLALVKEGFAWGAFLAPPLWAIHHRLWAVLAAVVAVAALLRLAVAALDLAGTEALSVVVAALLLFGCHANDLRRLILERRVFRRVGAVTAEDLPSAEARFLAAAPVPRRGPPATDSVLGYP